MNKKIRTLTALVSGASLFMAMTPGAHALSLNMDDVVNTMNSLKVQLIWLGIALAAFIVGMIACGKIKSKAKRYLARKQAVVAILAVVAIIINWVCLGPMSTLISLATGNGTVAEMRRNCRFVKITGAGLAESHVHDVQITRESPNYRLG